MAFDGRLAVDFDDRSAAVIRAAPLPKLRALSLVFKACSQLERLTADGDAHSAAVISAAPLSSLFFEGGEKEWSVPALSDTAAAGLEELRMTNCGNGIPDDSLRAVRSYTQLRTLVIEGCHVSDLGPLAGYVHLEELFIGGIQTFSLDNIISDLSPLGGCSKLRKLWIGGTQVWSLGEPEGLQACSQLERLTAGGDEHSADTISAAPLSKLKVLTFVVTGGGEEEEEEWSAPALSQTAAAGLEELRITSRDVHPNVSLEAVRSCT
ncbi:hypothetical protein FOA52_000893 [Chlamydomonas sp. UWO 241]|nr:hypothetical protein FOA52_000893 [Chlamydomonas sp. UWO 241]